jgi:hypothetical protein
MARSLKSGVGLAIPEEAKEPLPEGAPADFADPNFSLTGKIEPMADLSAKHVKKL